MDPNEEKILQEPDSDGHSIFNRFKNNIGDGNKRQGFMQIVRMDSGGVAENDRNALIMTPNQ